MGFRTGSFATIWEITPATDVRTRGRISISKKNRQTGEYETDFSGFVSFLGSTAAQKANRLKERDRIRLGDVDATTYYDKGKKITYYNFNIFSFETQEEFDTRNNPPSSQQYMSQGDLNPSVEEGFMDDRQPPF